MTGAQIAAKAVKGASALPGPTRRQAALGLLFQGTMYAAVLVGILSLGVLLFDVARDGAPQLTWGFLTEFPSRIRIASAGAESAIVGTLYLMVICAVFVVPVGVATAIYLEEYADRDKWYNRLVEVNIQNLAAVPSVVYGLLGLAFFVRGPLELGRVLLAGGLTLGLLVLPVVIIVAREAIRAVPPSIREGSMALGATQWQTIWKQVLPGSVAGIATGVILALSRAIGETAPLLIIGAAASPRFNPALPTDPLATLDSEFTAMPIQIFVWSTDANPAFQAKAAAAILVLMTLLVLMNSVAIYLRNRYEQKW